jgi:signal transduction histidine kinase
LDAFSELLTTVPENGFYNFDREGAASPSESSEFEDRADQRKQLTIEALPSKLADGRRHFMITLEEGSRIDEISRELRPEKTSRRSVPGEQKRAAGRRQLKRTKVQLRSIIKGLETSNREIKSAYDETQRKFDALSSLEQASRHDAERARAESEAAGRAKDHFLAMVSHELRSPLQGIVGRVEIIRSGVDREHLNQALAAIDRGVAKQVRLIQDLLEISSIVGGKVCIDSRPMNPVHAARRAIHAAMPAAREKRQELGADLTQSGNVLGDENRMEQVFSKLLNNAIEFTPHGGTIKAQSACSEDRFTLRIEDNGEGIESAFIAQVFDRFSQADPTIARRHGGLGLGLAIARTLVELHGGTIEAASPGIGLGTSITVNLPLAPEASQADETDRTTASPSAPADLPELQELDVLLVEDDAELLEVLAMTFEGVSARVRVARSAAEALTIFGEKRPDIMISDIAMPDRDGLYLVETIRKLHGKSVPAIALTGLASGVERHAIVTAGFDECVHKPIAPHRLIELTASLVRKRRP